MTSRPPGEVHFTDITEGAGIKFRHVSSPEKKYIVESMSGGVALFDYDNDGYLDIYLVNSLTVDMVKTKEKTRSALYHNNGDGTFTTALSPTLPKRQGSVIRAGLPALLSLTMITMESSICSCPTM